jgi:agmatinase
MIVLLSVSILHSSQIRRHSNSKYHPHFTSHLHRNIRKITKNRSIYISFDIDVLDVQYVPCTGTPEPFGLDHFEVIKILNSIDDSAALIGMDLVETALKNDDYREGTIASQILLRIFSRKYVHN